MTLKQLAQQVKIETAYGRAPYNENFPLHDNWLVTLRYHHKQITVPFYSSNEPTSWIVLGCLLLDADVENYGRPDDDQAFESWSRDFGYSPDSRKAYKIWQNCHKHTTKLHQLLGADFEKFIQAEC